MRQFTSDLRIILWAPFHVNTYDFVTRRGTQILYTNTYTQNRSDEKYNMDVKINWTFLGWLLVISKLWI